MADSESHIAYCFSQIDQLKLVVMVGRRREIWNRKRFQKSGKWSGEKRGTIRHYWGLFFAVFRKRLNMLSTSCANTRASPMVVMKLVSAAQRGTMWMCR